MVSSDRITAYIGTYTRRESFVDGKAEGIYIYHLDPSSGQLTHAATVAGTGTANPSFLTLGPDNNCLYAVNETLQERSPERDYKRLCHRSGNRASELSERTINPWHGSLLCQH